MVPVRDRPRTAVSLVKCGHQSTCSAEKRRKKTQRKPLPEGGAGARGTPEESTKTQNPFLPFVCSPFCGVATLRVLQILCGKSVDFLPEELQGRGLPGDLQKPVLGVVPVRLEKYRSGTAAHRANSTSIYGTSEYHGSPTRGAQA